jgi:hypothetical protein
MQIRLAIALGQIEFDLKGRKEAIQARRKKTRPRKVEATSSNGDEMQPVSSHLRR